MSEDTIFSEVSEELRRDRLRHGWRRYGYYVIGAAVLVVLVVAANEGWSWWQSSNAARSSDQFYAALNAENGGDLAAAQKALDTVIAQGTGQYPDLGKFKQAALLARQGKTADAQAAYDALASGQSNTRLKELALLFAANLLVDKGDVAGIKSRIEGMLNPADPLHNAASETIGLAQYKAGDLNGARDSFTAVLSDPQVSNDTRDRMQLYISQLVAQGATLPGAPAAAPATVAPTATTGSATTPAAAAATSPSASADATTPAGVESSQPVVPDAALGMAVPAPAATTAAPPASPDSSLPLLSTGAGLPSVPPPDATAAPAGTVSAPASSAPATPAPAAVTPAPAAATTPSAAATPAPAAATPAPATATTPLVPAAPAGK